MCPTFGRKTNEIRYYYLDSVTPDVATTVDTVSRVGITDNTSGFGAITWYEYNPYEYNPNYSIYSKHLNNPIEVIYPKDDEEIKTKRARKKSVRKPEPVIEEEKSRFDVIEIP